jgi:hypothetical protein
VFTSRAQSRVHGNERRRQGPFAEQVLQQIGNPERLIECVGGDRFLAEVPGEERRAREPRETADQNARPDRRVRPREAPRYLLDADGSGLAIVASVTDAS